MALQLPGGAQVAPFAAGPLSGAIGGQNQGNLQDTLSRNFRDSDLANQVMQNNYQQEMLNNPNLAAGRATDMMKQQTMQDIYGKGLMQQGMEGEIQSKIGAGRSALSKADMEDRVQHEEGIWDMAGQIKDGGESLKYNPKRQKEILDEIGKKYNIKGLPDLMTPDFMNQVALKALRAQNNLAELRKQRAEQEKYQQDVGVENAAAGKGRLEIGIDSRNALAAALAGAKVDNTMITMDDDKKVLLQARQKAEAGTLGPSDVEQVKGVILKTLKSGEKAIAADKAKETATSLARGVDKKVAITLAKGMGLTVDENEDQQVIAAKFGEATRDNIIKTELNTQVKATLAGADVNVNGKKVPIAKFLSSSPVEEPKTTKQEVTITPKGATSKSLPITHKIQDDADYAALPSGATFVGPDGVKRKKP